MPNIQEATKNLVQAFEVIEANQEILNFDSSVLPDFQAREFMHSQKVKAPFKIRIAKVEIVSYIEMIGYDSQLKKRILAMGKPERLADKISKAVLVRYKKLQELRKKGK